MTEKEPAENKTVKRRPVQPGLFTMADSPEGFHLIGGKCRLCGTVSFPRKKRCIKCFQDSVEDVFLNPRGKVAAWSVIRLKPFGFKDKVPYVLAEVQMQEGLQIRTHLTGIDPDNPEIKIGDDVEAVLEKIYDDDDGNEVMCYKFKKVAS